MIIYGDKITGSFSSYTPRVQVRERGYLYWVFSPGESGDLRFKIPLDHLEYPWHGKYGGSLTIEVTVARFGLQDFTETWYFIAQIVAGKYPRKYAIGRAYAQLEGQRPKSNDVTGRLAKLKKRWQEMKDEMVPD